MAGNGSDNHALLAALKHPLRREILRAMADRKPISPRELSDQLEESLSNVSYHVRVLAEYGVVEEIDSQQVRGATQHFYRCTLRAKWALTVLRGREKKRKRKP
ncbi:MAG TPA: helix-turn-helix domain-containing protein [Solirubrobacterales bacterium]|jgi:DNA-binding transcriptional ArsR family regulator|nr:helix-turn-helix domain-containing protein [Solirubrobacterales bacterium]